MRHTWYISLLFYFLNEATAEKDSLSWSAVGDWGGYMLPGLYQVPWGREVASSMNRLAASQDTDFILLIGDNFYEDGVQDIDDKRFVQTFERTFNNALANLRDMTFYMQSGNHDYRGNVTAQIMYSDLQKRWVYPDLWYTIKKTVGDFTVEIVMIDTNCLHDDTSTDETPDENRHAEQMQWFTDTMAASTADYLIVAGHHPIYSIAEHGSQQFMIDQILPVMIEHKAQLYINGHDHQVQYITNSRGMTFVTSGGATVPNPSRSSRSELRQYDATSEFFWARGGCYTHYVATATELKVSFIEAKEDNVLYQVIIPKRV